MESGDMPTLKKCSGLACLWCLLVYIWNILIHFKPNLFIYLEIMSKPGPLDVLGNEDTEWRKGKKELRIDREWKERQGNKETVRYRYREKEWQRYREKDRSKERVNR